MRTLVPVVVFALACAGPALAALCAQQPDCRGCVLASTDCVWCETSARCSAISADGVTTCAAGEPMATSTCAAQTTDLDYFSRMVGARYGGATHGYVGIALFLTILVLWRFVMCVVYTRSSAAKDVSTAEMCARASVRTRVHARATYARRRRLASERAYAAIGDPMERRLDDLNAACTADVLGDESSGVMEAYASMLPPPPGPAPTTASASVPRRTTTVVTTTTAASGATSASCSGATSASGATSRSGTVDYDSSLYEYVSS